MGYFWFIFSFVLSASDCPQWVKTRENLPECPDSHLIPETYPVGAIVISESSNDEEFAPKLVEKVFMASEKHVPKVILSVRDETFEKIKEHINSLNIEKKKKQEYLNALVQSKAPPYTWQQDYFKSFIDKNSGQVVLREIDNYKMKGDFPKNSYSKIIKASKDCGFIEGDPLGKDAPGIAGGHMGGNIEVLPGGYCLLGNDEFQGFKGGDEWSRYASEVCGSDTKKWIKAPTDWLQVGHTDEIYRVVKNKNKAAPCDFSVAIANPEKALEILEKAPNDPFLRMPKYKSAEESWLWNSGTFELDRLCKIYFEENQGKNKEDDKDDKKRGVVKSKSEVELKRGANLMEQILPSAIAAITIQEKRDFCPRIPPLKNRDIVNLYKKNSNLKGYVKLVQDKMNNFKKDIQSKVSECKVDFIDVPNLFVGRELINKLDGKQELPLTEGRSILPNPTNAINIGGTIISPEPMNDAFKNFVDEEYKKRGLKTDYIDSFEYSHTRGGNVHCSSHTIHVCKPRGAR